MLSARYRPAARSTTAAVLAGIFLCAALAGPASAGWARDVEPDTQDDLWGWWMWPGASYFQDPNRERIYFDVVPVWGTGVGPDVAPRGLGHEVVSPAVLSFEAFLGYWKDCNRDGYVGDAASGLMVYRAEARLQYDLCPWGDYHGSHNRDGWIAELVWIGPSGCTRNDAGEVTWCWCPTTTGCHDEVDFDRFVDDGHRWCGWGYCEFVHTEVWADFGRPWDNVDPQQDLVPARHGSFSSFGGLADWMDLASGNRVSGAVDGIHEGGVDGYVENETNLVRMPTQYQPVSPFWNIGNDLVKALTLGWDPLRGELDGQQYPAEADVARYYNDSDDYEEDGTAMKEVWDCDNPGGTEGVLPGLHPELTWIPNLGAPPQGSLAPTVGHAAKGLTGAYYEDEDSRRCGRDPEAMPYPYIEQPEPTTPAKHRTDVSFHFAPPRLMPKESLGGVLDVPTDLTQAYARPAGWFSLEQFVGWPIPLGYGYTTPTYMTSYADVKQYTYGAMPSEMWWGGWYGNEPCDMEYGVSQGWACDPEDWPEPGFWGVKVWQHYDIRDTDCYRANLLDPAVPSVERPPLPDPGNPQTPPAPTAEQVVATAQGTHVRIGRC